MLAIFGRLIQREMAKPAIMRSWRIGAGRRPSTVALLAAVMSATVAAPTTTPAAMWNVTEATEALTGATTIAASLPAQGTVLDMLGQPGHPTLVLRGKKKKLAAYVVWPQVLHIDYSGFSGQRTMVRWRFDDQPIQTDLWSLSGDGTSTGMFDTRDTAKFLRNLMTASRFAVRLTGSATQNASFEIGGVSAVAARVAGACDVALTAIR